MLKLLEISGMQDTLPLCLHDQSKIQQANSQYQAQWGETKNSHQN